MVNVAIAAYQARLFADGKTINHFVWGAAVAALACATWLWFHSWQLILALLLQRLVVFNTSLNLLRGKYFFYLGTASVLDRLLKPIYIPVYIAAVAGIVILEFFIHAN